jgi:hypothetical protein
MFPWDLAQPTQPPGSGPLHAANHRLPHLAHSARAAMAHSPERHFPFRICAFWGWRLLCLMSWPCGPHPLVPSRTHAGRSPPRCCLTALPPATPRHLTSSLEMPSQGAPVIFSHYRLATASPAPIKGRVHPGASSFMPSSAPALSSRRHRSPLLSHCLSAAARAPVSTPSASTRLCLRPRPLLTSSGELERPIGRAPVSPHHASVPGPWCTRRAPAPPGVDSVHQNFPIGN